MGQDPSKLRKKFKYEKYMFNDDSYASLHLNDILDSYFLENESQFSKINFIFLNFI